MTTFEVGFTVWPKQDFDPELAARIVAPYVRKGDDTSTQFGVRATHVYHFDGKLQWTNWDYRVKVTHDEALELAGKLRVMFPEVRVGDPTQERPDDAQWYGMYTERGAEEVAKVINATTALMQYADEGSLREAFNFGRESLDALSRRDGFHEAMDTSVRESFWNAVESYAKEYGFDAFTVQDAYEAVGA